MIRRQFMGLLAPASTFEAAAPQAHQDFLQSLGLSKTEIRKIRQESRQPD